MRKIKQVIVVRADLKMSRGKIAVQVAHASISAYQECVRVNEKWCEEWLNSGQTKIVCVVDDLEKLMAVVEKAKKLNIPHYIVSDMGLTELPPQTITCVGLGPAPSNLIDKITGSLRLLK